MQQVPAFSRLQTVPSAPPNTVGARPKLWILDSWRDLVLYVGTPMCLIWFATAVALSPYRLSDTLDTYYMCGGPFIPPSVVQLGQNAILGAAIFVSVLFAAHFVRTWIAGSRPNPVKLGLLVTSIAFWWYCNNLVSNILVGIALFEVFHDVQYLSLVWIYNRNRVEKDSNIGGVMRV